jgi:hypothetical protein
MKNNKALFLLIVIYILIFVFTTTHAYMANRELYNHSEEMAPEVLTTHLKYVSQATAQVKITLGALIGAMSAALAALVGGGKSKDE